MSDQEYLERSELAHALRGCSICDLRKTIQSPVPGEGPKDSLIVSIARSPGKDDDRRGRPFLGSSGEVFGECLQVLGLRREDMGLLNTISCFTTRPDNRRPTSEELYNCRPWREQQLSWFHRKLIVLAWGREAVEAVYGGVDRMTDIVGQVFNPCVAPDRGGIKDWVVIPLWHPAYLMRNAKTKRMFRDELGIQVGEKISGILKGGIPGRGEVQGELFK